MASLNSILHTLVNSIGFTGERQTIANQLHTDIDTVLEQVAEDIADSTTEK